jgi:hypothetical protein
MYLGSFVLWIFESEAHSIICKNNLHVPFLFVSFEMSTKRDFRAK